MQSFTTSIRSQHAFSPDRPVTSLVFAARYFCLSGCSATDFMLNSNPYRASMTVIRMHTLANVSTSMKLLLNADPRCMTSVARLLNSYVRCRTSMTCLLNSDAHSAASVTRFQNPDFRCLTSDETSSESGRLDTSPHSFLLTGSPCWPALTGLPC